MSLGGSTFLLKFVTLVAIGRVFHHCHYFGDTIVGALFGFLVVATFHYSELAVPAMHDLDKWVHDFVRSGLTKRGIDVLSSSS